jgi:hypothetical protein
VDVNRASSAMPILPPRHQARGRQLKRNIAAMTNRQKRRHRHIILHIYKREVEKVVGRLL